MPASFSFSSDVAPLYKSNLEPIYFRATRACVNVKNPLHQHDFFQFFYMEEGSCIHHINGFEFTQKTGDLVVIPPYLTHYLDTEASGDFSLIQIEFSDQLIDTELSALNRESFFNLVYLAPLINFSKFGDPILHFEGDEAEQLLHICNDLISIYPRQDPFFTTMARADVTKFLTLIIYKFASVKTIEQDRVFSQYRSSVQEALSYIDQNFTRKLYLQDICKKAMMSSSAFSSIFKNITGKTLVEYINYLRVLRAKELLMSSDKTILEIGLECGFRDAVNFSRTFKKITGYQPTHYRKMQGEPSTSL